MLFALGFKFSSFVYPNSWGYRRLKSTAVMDTPSVPLNFVPAETGETFRVGTIQIRIMEDGSRTDNRIGSAEFTVPPHTSG